MSSHPIHSLMTVAWTRRKSLVTFLFPSSKSVRLEWVPWKLAWRSKASNRSFTAASEAKSLGVSTLRCTFEN